MGGDPDVVEISNRVGRSVGVHDEPPHLLPRMRVTALLRSVTHFCQPPVFGTV